MAMERLPLGLPSDCEVLEELSCATGIGSGLEVSRDTESRSMSHSQEDALLYDVFAVESAVEKWGKK